VSDMVLMYRSILPFCWCAYGAVAWTAIPASSKSSRIFPSTNSFALSTLIALTLFPDRFSQRAFVFLHAMQAPLLRTRSGTSTIIRVIIEDSQEISLLLPRQYRVRTAGVDVNKIANIRGTMLIRRVRCLWALPDKTRNAVVRCERAGPCNPSDGVLGEYIPGGIHARVAQATVPKLRIQDCGWKNR
jgi:hypothetical protein